MKEDTDKEMNSTEGMVREVNNEEEKVSKMDRKPNNIHSKWIANKAERKLKF